MKRLPNGRQDKNASAHDFRRSFGERWSRTVMPAVLQRMMRHKSVLTTMRYYATGDAHALAQSIWETARKAG
ncbi:MAG TPA: hypothetical protein VGN57_07200 [Pirellulaceae bacterium]|nr:hypothetical protein [Pirellulaceae bacterium]